MISFTTPVLMDLAYATFLTGHLVTMGFNIREILRDKVVNGVSVYFIYYIAVWELYAPFYYYYLEQWITFSVAVFVTILSIFWAYLVKRYSS